MPPELIRVGKLGGRVAIVTGGARGIGRAICEAFVREGAAVAVADLNHSGAVAVAGELERQGGRCLAVEVDVADPRAVEAMVGATVAEFGTVDVLVNNAMADTMRDVVEMPLHEWQKMLDVTLTGVFLCSKAVLPTMVEQGSGRIINIGSQHALNGAEGFAHYCAAKAGVHGFGRALAREVARHGITVNAIAPGPIDTPTLQAMPEEWRRRKVSEVPLGRLGRPEEIAETAVLLASDGGGYYTGATLNVSGGDVMC